MTAANGLSRLLEPRSIAVVGATDRPGSYGETLLRNLERLGYDGEVWGVNPRRDRIRGVRCVASLAELPGPVDAVAVAVPAGAVPDIIDDAVALGCGGAVVVSAGFGEVESGRELEERTGRDRAVGRLSGLRAERQRDRQLPRPRPASGAIRFTRCRPAAWR